MDESENELKAGDFVVHGETAIVSKVVKVFPPGTFGNPVIDGEVVQLETKDFLLARDARGGPAFRKLGPAEALFFKQIVALVGHLARESAVIGKAIGLSLEETRDVILVALRSQVRGLSMPLTPKAGS